MSFTLVQSRWQGWVVRSQRCRRHHRKIQTIARLSPPVIIASALFVEARGGCRRGSEEDPARKRETREKRNRKTKNDNAAYDVSKKDDDQDKKEADKDEDEDDEEEEKEEEEDQAARRGIRANIVNRRRWTVWSRGSCLRSSWFLEDHRQERRRRRSRYGLGLAPFRFRFDRVASLKTRRKRGDVSLFASRDEGSRSSFIPFDLLLSSDEDEHDSDPDLSAYYSLSAIAR